MDRVLSFGGGVQTTALAVLAVEGKIKADIACFADTGCEKPETYWYMENYIKPTFKDIGLPFEYVRNTINEPTLYDYYWQRYDLPSVKYRRCTDHYKLRPMKKRFGKKAHLIIGFSIDEAYRVERKRTLWASESYPLIEMKLTAPDCHRIITSFGWPVANPGTLKP